MCSSVLACFAARTLGTAHPAVLSRGAAEAEGSRLGFRSRAGCLWESPASRPAQPDLFWDRMPGNAEGAGFASELTPSGVFSQGIPCRPSLHLWPWRTSSEARPVWAQVLALPRNAVKPWSPTSSMCVCLSFPAFINEAEYLSPRSKCL